MSPRGLLIGLGCLFLPFLFFATVIASADCSVNPRCDMSGLLVPIVILAVFVVPPVVIEARNRRLGEPGIRRQGQDLTDGDAARDTVADE